MRLDHLLSKDYMEHLLVRWHSEKALDILYSVLNVSLMKLSSIINIITHSLFNGPIAQLVRAHA